MLLHYGKPRRLPLPRSGQTLTERYGHLLDRDLAIRLASNQTKLGLAIPELSADPWEDYLLKEAILLRYQDELAEREREQREEEAFAAAREENEQWRKDYLAGKTAGG